MRVTAILHTQCTNADLSLLRIPLLRALWSGGEKRLSTAFGQQELRPALACGGVASGMDLTDESDISLAHLLQRRSASAQPVAPEVPVESLPSRFRLLAASVPVSKQEDTQEQRSENDPHAQILVLYHNYRPHLFAYIRSLYLTRDETEEVIQEAFLRLANKLWEKVEIQDAQGWIIHVAHDLAVDLIRRRERDANRFQEMTDVEFASVQDRVPDPEETLLEKEQREEMEAALARMTPQQRQCFELRTEGFRYKDIGKALGISEQRAALIVKQVTIRLAAICG